MQKENDNIVTDEDKSVHKTRLKGLTLSELQEYFASTGEPKFRAEQVFNWMYNHLADDFMEMTPFIR